MYIYHINTALMALYTLWNIENLPHRNDDSKSIQFNQTNLPKKLFSNYICMRKFHCFEKKSEIQTPSPSKKSNPSYMVRFS